MGTTREVTAAEFRARCLDLVDEVAETGLSVDIMRHGKAVARLEAPAPRRALRGSAKLNLSDHELVTASMSFHYDEP